MGKIKIADMLVRRNIEDSDLIIVEDKLDTKQSTIKDLKRVFNGDGMNPSQNKFYSSKQVKEMYDSLNVYLSLLPNASDVNYLKSQVDSLIKDLGAIQNGEKDPEIVAARAGYDTLPIRLQEDELEREKKYIQFPKLLRSGPTVDLYDANRIAIDVSAPEYPTETTVEVIGGNLFNLDDITTSTGIVKNEENKGFDITFTQSAYVYNIPVFKALPVGTYYMYASFFFENGYVKEGTVLKAIAPDGSATVISTDYKYDRLTSIYCDKGLRYIQIVPAPGTIVDDMKLIAKGVMISQYNNISEYIPHTYTSFTVPADTAVSKTNIIGYKCTVKRSEGVVQVTGKDIMYTGDKIKEEIDEIKSYTTHPEDFCGMLENKGDYYYFDGNTVSMSPDTVCILDRDDKKTRNSRPSIKITLVEHNFDEEPKFTFKFPESIDMTNNSMISFQLYIPKTFSEKFDEDDGFKIMISSDQEIANPAANYYYFNIGSKSFIQGWNTIKLKLNDFLPHGTPTWQSITQIGFRIFSSELTNGKSLWVNSVILDQRMKPTVIFSFDHFYSEAFDYQYPYLYNRNFPVTIFANDKMTLTRDYMAKVATLHYEYGWDLGTYGCNPDKERMLEDDNARDQYLAVRETRQWLYDNFTENVISYAAPFGNLRPITEPILRNMGFKMAKVEADQYLSFFSKEDLCVPVHLLSNAEGKNATEIKAKIDEIVETGQCLCIYTNDVTRYGDEISATKASFESVVKYILDLVEKGELQIMTFSEFYNKCIDQ